MPGWGNQPQVFGELLGQTQALTGQVQANHLDAAAQDALLEALLKFQQWHYVLPTTPALVVLDTRTRRWRSGSPSSNPLACWTGKP